MEKICKIKNCGRVLFARGWCGPHYKRWWRHGDPVVGRPLDGSAQAFLKKVVFKYKKKSCLIWPFSRTSRGYATMRMHGKSVNVSRFTCKHFKGPPPTPQHEAAHRCGEGDKGCVSPFCLRWATPAENQADRLTHGTHNRGERCGLAKLNKRDVKIIRKLKGRKTQVDIAREFGVSKETIYNILHRRTWAWLN